MKGGAPMERSTVANTASRRARVGFAALFVLVVGFGFATRPFLDYRTAMHGRSFEITNVVPVRFRDEWYFVASGT